MSGRGPYDHQADQNSLFASSGVLPNSRERKANQRMRSTCETCDRVIPSNHTQCKFCDAENVKHSSPSSSGETTDESWSYDRVVLAVVPASNRYHAAALGSAAFGLVDFLADGNHVSRSDAQTIYDFTRAPASSLTSDWGRALPSTVRIDTNHGQQLIEKALAKTGNGAVDTTSAHLFGVEGTPIGEADELERLLEADETYWLVPGIVRRYSSPLPDGPTEMFECECHSFATPHVYTGRAGVPRPYDEPARPIWVCTICRNPTYGPEPKPDEVGLTSTIPGPMGEPVEVTLPSHPDQHDQTISAYHERYGNYPWEDTERP